MYAVDDELCESGERSKIVQHINLNSKKYEKILWLKFIVKMKQAVQFNYIIKKQTTAV